jgi:hypothetical protein
MTIKGNSSVAASATSGDKSGTYAAYGIYAYAYRDTTHPENYKWLRITENSDVSASGTSGGGSSKGYGAYASNTEIAGSTVRLSGSSDGLYSVASIGGNAITTPTTPVGQLVYDPASCQVYPDTQKNKSFTKISTSDIYYTVAQVNGTSGSTSTTDITLKFSRPVFYMSGGSTRGYINKSDITVDGAKLEFINPGTDMNTVVVRISGITVLNNRPVAIHVRDFNSWNVPNRDQFATVYKASDIITELTMTIDHNVTFDMTYDVPISTWGEPWPSDLSWDPATGIVTMNGYSGYQLQNGESDKVLRLNTVGTNVLSDGISAEGRLELGGSGTLNTSSGINAKGGLTIKSGTVNATAYSYAAVNTGDSDIKVTGTGTLNAVTTDGIGNYGITANALEISTTGHVTATGSNTVPAIYLSTGEITFGTVGASHYTITPAGANPEDAGTITYTYSAASTGSNITGTLISWNNTDNAAIRLYASTVSDAAIKTDMKLATSEKALPFTATKGSTSGNIDGKRYNQSFSIAGVSDGAFKLAVYKPGYYVPKILTVTVSGSNINLDEVKMWLYGDVNYDGIVNGTDALQMKRKISGSSSVMDTGDAQTQADRFTSANVSAISGSDVLLNSTDVLQVSRYISGQASIFSLID